MWFYAPLTVAFAYCSIVYELYLAQTLTSVLGGTHLRYAMTIGLYITSMGIGALFLPKFSKRSPFQNLFYVELFLITAGFFSIPFILGIEQLRLIFEGIAPLEYDSSSLAFLSQFLFSGALHFPILAIGVLSGLELPLLMQCSQYETNKTSVTFRPDVLAWDYVGTVLGALLFPFLLFPVLGVFGVAFLTMSLNAFALTVVVFANKEAFFKDWQKVLCLFCFASLIILFFWRAEVGDFIVNRLYF